MDTILETLAALFPGLGTAAVLAGITLALAYPLGAVFALCIDAPIRFVRLAAVAVVEVGRGLPLLVLLYLIYRGLPQADIVLDPLPSAVIAFTWSIGSYATEMIRSSIQAVPDGQTDAARALNLPDRVAFFSVILPQALRIAIPPLMNLAIKTFQLTSLGYAITLSEVMQAAHRHGSVHFKFLESFVVAAVIYAAVIIPCSVLARRLERRLSLHLRPVQGVNATTQ